MAYVDFDSPTFITLLQGAQDGDIHCRQLVILATLPVIWSLSPCMDEAQDLIVHLVEYVIPKWTEVRPWGLHANVCLSSKLKTLRRTRARRRERGLGWL